MLNHPFKSNRISSVTIIFVDFPQSVRKKHPVKFFLKFHLKKANKNNYKIDHKPCNRNLYLPCGNDFLTCGNDLLSCDNDLLTCGNDFLTCGNDLLSCGKVIKNGRKTVLCPFLGSVHFCFCESVKQPLDCVNYAKLQLCCRDIIKRP